MYGYLFSSRFLSFLSLFAFKFTTVSSIETENLVYYPTQMSLFVLDIKLKCEPPSYTTYIRIKFHYVEINVILRQYSHLKNGKAIVTTLKRSYFETRNTIK